jgi:hypothetical protein
MYATRMTEAKKMGYKEYARITLKHDYHEGPAVDLSVILESSKHHGFIMRRIGDDTVIFTDGSSLPPVLSFLISTSNTLLYSITRGVDWGELSTIDLKGGQNDWVFGPDIISKTSNSSNQSGAFAILALPPSTDESRYIRLRFEAEDILWRYNIRGIEADHALEIVDSEGTITFDDLGMGLSPNGTPMRVFQAQQSIPARAHPRQRFSLCKRIETETETLIPLLPNASAEGARPNTDPDIFAALISDIFVSTF